MSSELRLEALAESFVDRIRSGEQPEIEQVAAQHPELATKIRRLFPVLQMMEQEHRSLDDYSEESLLAEEMRLMSQLPPMKRLGDYRLIRELGRGGMGVVFLAEQESLGRNVALKVLPDSLQFDQRRQQRFQQEARASAMLHHTNIVPIFGVGQSDNLSYLVMQYIEGQSLDLVLNQMEKEQANKASSSGRSPVAAHPNSMAKELQRMRGHALSDASDERLRDTQADAVNSQETVVGSSSSISHAGADFWRQVARIGQQVASALAHAHGKGILHRDIKPSNLLLEDDGTIWVTDFGLAKYMDSPDLTRSGEFVGTLRYMSPEQLSGQAGPCSDIYSLGLTLFELLTLRPAFDALERPALLKQVSSGAVPSVASVEKKVPRDLATIVDKCLAMEPSGRYLNAESLWDDLTCFLDGQPIAARQISGLERLVKWCRRNPLVASLVSGLVLAILTGGAGVIWQWRQTEIALERVQDEKTRTSEALIALQGEQKKTQQALQQAELEKERALKQSELSLTTLTDVIRNYQMAFDSLNYQQGRMENLIDDDLARREMLKTAVASMQQVSQQLQDRTDYSLNLMIAHTDLGDLFLDIGDEDLSDGRDQGEAEYRKALEIGRKLVAESPEDRYLRRMFAQVLERMGKLEFYQGNNVEARKWTREAIVELDAIWEQEPNSFAIPNTLIYSNLLMATLAIREYQLDEARIFLTRVDEVVRIASERGQDVLAGQVEQNQFVPVLAQRWRTVQDLPQVYENVNAYRNFPVEQQAGLLYNCSSWHLTEGNVGRALDCLKMIDDLPEVAGNQWYNAACGYSKCYRNLALTGVLERKPEDGRQLVAAVAKCLESARESGFFDDPSAVALLLRDADLDCLRELPAFQETVESIRQTTTAESVE